MNSRLTFCPSGPLGNREPVEIERCAKVRASHCLFRLKRDSGRIGDAVDRVEEADHARGVDQPRTRHPLSADVGELRGGPAGRGAPRARPARRPAAQIAGGAADQANSVQSAATSVKGLNDEIVALTSVGEALAGVYPSDHLGILTEVRPEIVR